MNSPTVQQQFVLSLRAGEEGRGAGQQKGAEKSDWNDKMRSRHARLMLPPRVALLELLLVLLLGLHVVATCPSGCSCSPRNREVDCSRRGLRLLPDGLQHNVHSLNLSHNRLHNLDGQLTVYTHLRILDLSHNRLSRLPVGLPRSLWTLHAASNCLQLLDKNDTVYQWNLRTLDLSNNKLQRAILVNNTLIRLNLLNLSHNRLLTLPTNMPTHLEAIDLSHNLLVRVLPGSLDRLNRLTHFYLHANRFSTLPYGVLDKLTLLRVISFGSNPWACHIYADISYILSWTHNTPARVLGCPCHTQPVCGEGRTGGRHYTQQPHLAGSTQDLSSMLPEASVTRRWYSSVSPLLSTAHSPKKIWSTPHRPFTATPISISTLPPRGPNTHTSITRLSESASPAAAERMLRTDSHLVSYTKEVQSTVSLRATQPPISDTSSITQTAIRADTTLATDRFLTTESPSIQTKKTTTLHTRSVHPSGGSSSISSSGGSISSSSSSSISPLVIFSPLPLLHKMGLLSLILQIFL